MSGGGGVSPAGHGTGTSTVIFCDFRWPTEADRGAPGRAQYHHCEQRPDHWDDHVCACGQKHPGRRLSDQVFNGRLPDPPRLFVVDRAKDPSGVEDLVLPDPPRRFVLDRAEDPSGVSGLGIVAEGVEFSDGTAALRWLGEHPSTTVWGSVADIEAVHGHGGSTRTRWVDEWAEL